MAERYKVGPARDRFAKEHGIPRRKVNALALMARSAALMNEHECNGDPHRLAKDRTDKNECAKLWGEDLERHTAGMRIIAEAYGFTVEYTGLRPCLRDAAGRYIEIPH